MIPWLARAITGLENISEEGQQSRRAFNTVTAALNGPVSQVYNSYPLAPTSHSRYTQAWDCWKRPEKDIVTEQSLVLRARS